MGQKPVFKSEIIMPQMFVEGFISSLHSQGIVELVRKSGKAKPEKTLTGMQKLKDTSHSIKAALEKHKKREKKSILDNFKRSKEAKYHILDYSNQEFIQHAGQYLQEIQERLNTLLSIYRQSEAKLSKVTKERDVSGLLPQIPVSNGSTRGLRLIAGALDQEKVTEIRKRIPASSVLITKSSGKKCGFLILSQENTSDTRALNLKDASLIDLSAYELNEEFLIQEAVQKRFNKLAKEKKSIQQKLEALHEEEMLRLSAIDEELQNRAGKLSHIIEHKDDRSLAMLEAYAPVENLEQIKNTIESFTGYYYFRSSKSEDAPIIYKNIKPIRFFETITNLYSPPRSGYFDPTFLIAISFSIFFAFMLTDFFYGIAVFLIGAIIYWGMAKASKGLRSFAGVLMVMGSFTVALGVIFGSYFGDLFQSSSFQDSVFGGISQTFSSLVSKYAVLNSLTDIIPMLSVVIVLGLLHLSTGYFAGFMENISKSKVQKALADQGVWILFIAGLVCAVLSLALKKQMLIAAAALVLSLIHI